MLAQGESDYRYAAKDIKEGLQHMMPAARTRANAVYYGFIVLSLGLIVMVRPLSSGRLMSYAVIRGRRSHTVWKPCCPRKPACTRHGQCSCLGCIWTYALKISAALLEGSLEVREEGLLCGGSCAAHSACGELLAESSFHDVADCDPAA